MGNIVAALDYIEILKSSKKSEWKNLQEILKPEGLFFKDIEFDNCDWENLDFTRTTFIACTFKKCNFKKADLSSAVFEKCNFLNNCDLSECLLGPINNANATTFSGENSLNITLFDNAILKDIQAKHTIFNYIRFNRCNLSGSKFTSCSFTSVSFLNSTLNNCNFRWSHFCHEIAWQGAIFDRKTNFSEATFQNEYPIDNDKSAFIKINWREQPSWSYVHFLSSIPVFQVSFFAFLISIFIGNIIITLNEYQYIKHVIEYNIPMPQQILKVIESTAYLVLGSLLYKFFCPQNVQNFTESEWVVEHNRQRPKYKQETLEHPIGRALCIACLSYGGSLSLYIIACRVIDIIRYLIN